MTSNEQKIKALLKTLRRATLMIVAALEEYLDGELS